MVADSISKLARLPLSPFELAAADMAPIERGKLYNDLDLCSFQRFCVEEALRLVASGEYPGAAS